MKKEKPIHLAFIGCGFATQIHSKTLSGFKDDVLCYYASRSREKAIRFNQKYHGSGYFESYESVLNASNIDVVLIATPPISHLDLAVQFLKAGKHVIVEKPPFLHSSDFDTIRKVQNETGQRVFVAENYFYKPVAIQLRELIRNEIIGEVLFVYINALKMHKTDDWRNNSLIAGGGALFEGGIHWMNFIANLGLTAKNVHGFYPLHDTGSEQSVLVAIEYAEGAAGALYHSWEVPSLLKGLRLSKIFGREGSITFESNGLFVLSYGRKKRFYFPGLRDISGYRGMFADFIRALRTGEEPMMNLDVAQRDLTLIENVYQTLEARHRIDI